MSDTADLVTEKPSPLQEDVAPFYEFLLEIIGELEKIDDEMQIQRLKTYLLVMRYPELSTQQLAEKAGIPKPSMSRNLSSLGSWNPLTRKEGYGLVYGREFRGDRRVKFHTLTQKGCQLRDSILSIIIDYAGIVTKIRQQS